MKIFPTGGPYTPLRLFSALESIISCVWFADEKEVKVMERYVYSEDSCYISMSRITDDLDVLFGPAAITDILC